MMNDKVLLTYKRKRFSHQTDIAHAIEATGLSPSMQRGSPWISTPKSEFDTDDEKPKNLHSEKCHCSPSISRCGFTESIQRDIPATKGMAQITVQNNMGPMVLRSRRVLSSTLIENDSRRATTSTGNASQNSMKDVIQVDASGRKSGLDYTITCAEGSLTPGLTVHDQIGNTINLNVSISTDGGDISECTVVGAKVNPYSDNNDNVLLNGGSLKEHSVVQLITFSRRAKPTQEAGERTDRNSKTTEKLSFSSSCSSHVVGANFSCEGSSQKFIEEQVLPIRLENCVVPSSQVEVADESALEMADIKVDDSSVRAGEFFTGSMIKQKFKNSSESRTPVNTCQELPEELLAPQPIVVVEGHPYPANPVPSISGNNTFSLSVDDSGSKSNTCTNNYEKRTLTFLTERDPPVGADLSVAPTSISQMKLETNKRSDDGPENHRGSQTSSTPCCSFVLADEEDDARNKEIEWLESLENILRKRKEDGGTCSLVVHEVKDRRVASTPIMPNKSAEQSVKVQDIAIDFVNQSFPQKISLTKFPFPGSVEQQKSDRSAPFTDFLSCYLPSNRDIPLDLNAATSSSGSHFMDKVHSIGRKLPYSSSVNPSLFMHKKPEKTIAEKMPCRRRDFFSDEPKRYLKEWSEEELDFLWIGVRRHGVDNWKAILGDSKLHFARSRFPEELSLQWEEEQKKLFNGISVPPASLSQATASSTWLPDVRCPSKAHPYVEVPMSPAETKLSLGDVYLRNESFTKNTPFHADYPPTASLNSFMRPLQCSYSLMSSHAGAPARHKKSSGASRTMYPLEYGSDKQFWERSGNELKPAGFPSTNLPHWLKEVYSSSPSDMIPWPPFLTAGTSTSMANIDLGNVPSTTKHCEPLASSKDLRGRGILKRKSVLSQRNACISRVEEASASVDEPAALGIKPSVVLIPVQTPAASEKSALGVGASLQKNIAAPPDNIPMPVVPNDLVVIDSDASSEETISDDQNMRSYQDQEQID